MATAGCDPAVICGTSSSSSSTGGWSQRARLVDTVKDLVVEASGACSGQDVTVAVLSVLLAVFMLAFAILAAFFFADRCRKSASSTAPASGTGSRTSSRTPPPTFTTSGERTLTTWASFSDMAAGWSASSVYNESAEEDFFSATQGSQQGPQQGQRVSIRVGDRVMTGDETDSTGGCSSFRTVQDLAGRLAALRA